MKDKSNSNDCLTVFDQLVAVVKQAQRKFGFDAQIHNRNAVSSFGCICLASNEAKGLLKNL